MADEEGVTALRYRDSVGNTPFNIASIDGTRDIIGILTEYCIIIERGKATLVFHMKSWMFACGNMLWTRGYRTNAGSAGADVNVGDIKTGKTALHIACLTGNNYLVRLYS